MSDAATLSRLPATLNNVETFYEALQGHSQLRMQNLPRDNGVAVAGLHASTMLVYDISAKNGPVRFISPPLMGYPWMELPPQFDLSKITFCAAPGTDWLPLAKLPADRQAEAIHTLKTVAVLATNPANFGEPSF